jgi:hypothetical protein
MGSVPRAPAFDPSSMLVNPAEAQQWAYLSEVLKNAPNPTAAANANLAALRAGTGIGGEPSFGGFGSRQPIGGPAFSGPGLTAPSEGAFPVFGGTGDPGRYADPTNPSADAYARWRALTSSYPAATAPADGGGGDYYDSEPYFDPNE